MSTKSKKVAGYIRVSRKGKRDNFQSPEEQRAAIEQLAEERDFKVVRWVEEIDASGGDDKRPGWNEVRQAVAKGELDGVVVYDFSRWSRDTEKALTSIREMREANGDIWSAMERFDTTTPEGEFMLTNFFGQATLQRATVGRRFTARRKKLVAQGIHVAGHVPIGYVRGEDGRLAPDPETRDLVLGVFERRAKGESYAKIARWLAEQGHPRTAEGVVSMLRNGCYLGEARHGDTVTKDAHEAIVPRSLWKKCQEKQKASARTGKLGGRFLLQGIATCASCGRPLYLTQGNAQVPVYYCRRLDCDERAYAQAHRLDTFVLSVLFGVEDEPGLVDTVSPETWVPLRGDGREVDEAQFALDEARADLDGFRKDTKLRRTMGAELYAETMGDYVTAVNAAEADLAEARERSTGGLELVGRLWLHDWGWAERREYLERILGSVIVNKGREPLSKRCEVELRQR